MQIEITTPTVTDDANMVRVVGEAWQDTYPCAEVGISETDVQTYIETWSTPEVQDRRRRNLKKFLADDSVCYKVAKIDQEIVGVMRAQEHDTYVQLYSMYVLPDAQGTGVGSALMKLFLAWANPDKQIRLHVASYNEQAIKFYESWGFTKSGEPFVEERFRFKSGAVIPQIKMVLKPDEYKV